MTGRVGCRLSFGRFLRGIWDEPGGSRFSFPIGGQGCLSPELVLETISSLARLGGCRLLFSVGSRDLLSPELVGDKTFLDMVGRLQVFISSREPMLTKSRAGKRLDPP